MIEQEGSQHEPNHQLWMRLALEQAIKAKEQGEVPVGAVLVKDQQLIGEGFNQVITLNDPTAHAEIMALRAAGDTLRNYRHPETVLYVTLEPCTMCAGALIHARIQHVYFGAYDQKTGVASSVCEIFTEPYHNHQVDVTGGILQQECSELLSAFFRDRRQQKKEAKHRT